MGIAAKLTCGLLACAVVLISTAGVNEGLVCFGADGHVGVVDVEGGSCHDHSEPDSTDSHGEDVSAQPKSCTDIAIPAGLAIRANRSDAKPVASLCLAPLTTIEPVPSAPTFGLATTDAPPPGSLALACVRVVVLQL